MIPTLHGEIPCRVFLYPKSSDDFLLRQFAKPGCEGEFYENRQKLGKVHDVSQTFCTNSRTYMEQLAKRCLQIYNEITKGSTEKRTKASDIWR